LAALADERRPRWERTTALAHHAAELPVRAVVGPELEAIVERRCLLDDPDPLRPLTATLAEALRAALSEHHRALVEAVGGVEAALARDATWARLEPSDQAEIRREVGLAAPPAPGVGTD